MLVVLTVNCPECEVEDTTTVEVEEPGLTWVTTECVNCTNPYVLKVETKSEAVPYRITKAD